MILFDINLLRQITNFQNGLSPQTKIDWFQSGRLTLHYLKYNKNICCPHLKISNTHCKFMIWFYINDINSNSNIFENVVNKICCKL